MEDALDKRTSMGMIGNLDKYLQYQTAQGIGNGGSNSALDMGMGFAVANKMAEALNKPAAATPPPSTG